MSENSVSIHYSELDYRTNEAYKALRTNIQFCGDNIKVISLTSCTPNEGKSSISLNMAVAFADIGKKVAFIDADLRKSVIKGKLKVGRIECGLTHYLSGQSGLEDIIYNTNIRNLDMIFTGSYTPNPVELLSHERFTFMIKKLREEYDYVIIDTPPLGSVIDSAIVAKHSDGVIIVIEHNTISYKYAQYVKEQLEVTQCRILGVVLNKIPVSKKRYNGKYYGRYYGKYYGNYYGTYGDEHKR